MIVKVKEPVEKEYSLLSRKPGAVYLPAPGAPARTDRPAARDQCHWHRLRNDSRSRRHSSACSLPCPKWREECQCKSAQPTWKKKKAAVACCWESVPGVPPATVCILGGGIVGTNAAKIALGMGANVTIVDLNLNRLRELDDIFNGRVYTLASNSYNVARAVQGADLVIGGVLIPGASAPRIVTRQNGLTHEERRRRGRCRDRPGRLHRNRTSHHPQRSFFSGRRSGPLLRHQHARGRSQHIDPGPHQRYLSLTYCDWHRMAQPPPSKPTLA